MPLPRTTRLKQSVLRARRHHAKATNYSSPLREKEYSLGDTLGLLQTMDSQHKVLITEKARHLKAKRWLEKKKKMNDALTLWERIKELERKDAHNRHTTKAMRKKLGSLFWTRPSEKK